MTLEIVLPRHQVGTKFTYRYGKNSYDAEVIGYHIEHNTDTGNTDVTYRIVYSFIPGLQDTMTATVARSTVDKALATA